MKHTTPQSLLSLPPEMQIPEAYRVLGLAAFESDKAKIKAAAEAILVRLKDAKETADKAAWEKSIVWVKNAQAILGDSGKKAAYDRKLAAASHQTKFSAAGNLRGIELGPWNHRCDLHGHVSRYQFASCQKSISQPLIGATISRFRATTRNR